MPNIQYTRDMFDEDVEVIIHNIENDDWRPDVVVGLSRGGLIPAVILSHRLSVDMIALNWSNSLQDERAVDDIHTKYFDKNVLVVDDLVDSGKILNLLFGRIDRFSRLGINADLSRYRVATLLNNTDVKTLYENVSSRVVCNYTARPFSRQETPEWFDFYWEK